MTNGSLLSIIVQDSLKRLQVGNIPPNLYYYKKYMGFVLTKKESSQFQNIEK